MPSFIYYAGNPSGTLHNVVCSRCGNFQISDIAIEEGNWNRLNTLTIANISGYIRDNQGLKITSRDTEFLKALVSPSVAEKARKLLRWLAKIHPVPGADIGLSIQHLDDQVGYFLELEGDGFPSDNNANSNALRMFPLLSYAWAESQCELEFLLSDYLSSRGFLIMGKRGINEENIYVSLFRIAPAGWELLESVNVTDSNIGFVAMWFDPTMDNIWENGFYPSIKSAGYSASRIDKKEHNNKIDDEIIAAIRGSRFVVADFTGGRGGVYYEAGFAAGLDKPVIWTVREDWLDKLHFDTRQYNHITWQANDLDAFTKALKNRIEATIGKGNLLVGS